jgi:hypothetical protein
MTTWRLFGRVTELTGFGGIAGLRVEAWDKDLIYNDLVGSAVTDKLGTFQMEFDESYFQELFLDRRPDLFFRVFEGDRLIKSTEDSVLWNVDAGETEITLKVSQFFEGDLKQLIALSEAEGVKLVNWFLQGQPDTAAVTGTFEVTPELAGNLVGELLKIERLRLYLDVFPLGSPNPETILIQFDSSQDVAESFDAIST